MAQHFLLSKAAKTLSLMDVFKATDEQVEKLFAALRWPETNGEAACVHCGSVAVYDCRRPNGAPRFRCKDCGKDFSITSGTLFASHKMPLRIYLAAILLFCNEVKGKSMLAMGRMIALRYNSSHGNGFRSNFSRLHFACANKEFRQLFSPPSARGKT